MYADVALGTAAVPAPFTMSAACCCIGAGNKSSNAFVVFAIVTSRFGKHRSRMCDIQNPRNAVKLVYKSHHSIVNLQKFQESSQGVITSIRCTECNGHRHRTVLKCGIAINIANLRHLSRGIILLFLMFVKVLFLCDCVFYH